MRHFRQSYLGGMTLAIGLAGILSACGAERASYAQVDSQQSQASALFAELDGSSGQAPDDDKSSAADCDTIKSDLEEHRAALASTPEWAKLVETPGWHVFSRHLEEAEKNHCWPHEPAPSAKCRIIGTAIHTDMAALKLTSEWQAAAATPEWKVVKEDYAAAKENHCWAEWKPAKGE